MTTGKSFFGHPRGLATLFFTEMWERFSYYGMRALLLLYMTKKVSEGGMGLSDENGGAIYGLYTMFVYLLALPGGWIADKYFGLRKAIFIGGCIIALGHACLAIPSNDTFFLGLAFIAIGTGLLKPNISSTVGELYPASEQARRDSGFTIFYMGINIGAFLSPLITSPLGQEVNWHYGFAAAGVGMVIGLIQYKLTEKYMGEAGLHPVKNPDATLQAKSDRRIRTGILLFIIAFAALVVLMYTRVVVIDPTPIAKLFAVILISTVILYFAYIFTFEKLTREEKKKLAAIPVFFIMCALFYGGYEQQGSSLNLFADRYTDLHMFGLDISSGVLQSVPPFYVFVFAPMFAWLWIKLSNRNLNPTTTVKLALGPIFMGLGFVAMIGASMVWLGGSAASPWWLMLTYLLHTFGEICLYPVVLSAVTKLSPQRLVGQMMGIIFMALALGNLVAGLIAGSFDREAIEADPHLLVDFFWKVARVMLVAGVVGILISKPMRKLMGEVR